jgi:hypothetical protein
MLVWEVNQRLVPRPFNIAHPVADVRLNRDRKGVDLAAKVLGIL